jgi:plasmid stabilization system protein ParE
MSLSRSDDFIADVERQFEWYVSEAGWQVADGYLNAVETTCRLVEKHPQIGPVGHFSHVRLRHWRFFVLLRPFNRHVVFYEVAGEDVIMRRAMHGRRNLPRRLLEPPSGA